MHFEITSSNVVGTTITIEADTGETYSAVLPLPGISVDFVFTLFGTQPLMWTFDVSTESDTFFVSWCLWSTWVPTVPVITGLSAAVGIAGTPMTVSGSGLGGVTSVQFGVSPATITYYSDTPVDVILPPGSGTVDVTVTTPVGTSAITPADQFTYIPPPAITAVFPTRGLAGDSVTVLGTGFTGATDISVGAQSVNPAAISDTQITLSASPGSGTVDVRVTTRRAPRRSPPPTSSPTWRCQRSPAYSRTKGRPGTSLAYTGPGLPGSSTSVSGRLASLRSPSPTPRSRCTRPAGMARST